MTRDAKMGSEGTFEQCENGTNELAVQRSLSILLRITVLRITVLQHRHAYFQNQ